MDIHAAQQDLRNFFREAALGAGASLVRGGNSEDAALDFALSIAAGLGSHPRRLDSRFLYDARGSALFEQITAQPEYYLTRTESAILAENASRIRDICGPAALVELGSGSSAKTDHLIRAWVSRDQTVRYVPVDVSEKALVGACRTLAGRHPQAIITAVNSDYGAAFPIFRELSPTLVLFLGSSIGNFTLRDTTTFLSGLAAALAPGDFLLLGLDLVKDPSVIEAAYNDSAGVTADFTRNLFGRMNRDLGTSIDLSVIEHEARYNPEREQIETRALFTERQTIRIKALSEMFVVGKGERILVEISRKFRIDEFLPYAEDFGLYAEEVFLDDRGWFGLLLLRRKGARVSDRGTA